MGVLNKNDPQGGEVSEVSAREFSLTEALPVNENIPRGDDVACVTVHVNFGGAVTGPGLF